MSFYEQRVRHLLRLFADNKATEQQIREMLSILRKEEGDKILESFLSELRMEPDYSSSQLAVGWDSIWEKIHESAIQPRTPVYKMKWLYRAAAIIFLIGIGAYFFNRNPKIEVEKTEPVVEVKNDILPGGSKAILTLGNGSQIVLDNASLGKLAQQGNTEVIKQADGQLIYKGTGEPVNEVLYNTVSTPRGGQYNLILPDGSGVWLNAVSSIRYPTAFTGKDRFVEITGEAYFEVAKDPSRPFRVLVNPHSGNGDMEVAVLGTHFNINSYKDEPSITTTLLEGSIKVSKGVASSIIKPGQQTELNINGKINVIEDANVSEAVAWKEGRFEFNGADLKTILRQVMRWYDVEVEYQGTVSDRYFTAAISRNKTLSGLLKILKQSDVDFKLEGKKLTVNP